MKRKLFALLLATLLLGTVLCLSVFADELLIMSNETALVVDEAGTLTDAELSSLEAKAERISQAHDCKVAVVVVQSLNGADIGTTAETRFLDLGMKPDGILFLHTVDDRDWTLVAMGKGIDAVTDYGEEQLAEAIASSMRSGAYAQAYQTALNTFDSYLTQYEQGQPFDDYSEKTTEEKSGFSWAGLLAGIGGGALFGGLCDVVRDCRMVGEVDNRIRPCSPFLRKAVGGVDFRHDFVSSLCRDGAEHPPHAPCRTDDCNFHSFAHPWIMPHFSRVSRMTARFASVVSHNGRRKMFSASPIIASASLTGIGFESMNRFLKSG